jgi:hypothetical protein
MSGMTGVAMRATPGGLWVPAVALLASCAAAVPAERPPAEAPGRGADIVAKISGPRGAVPPGSTVTYRVTVANRGPDAAPGTVGFVAVDSPSRVEGVTTTAGRCTRAKGEIRGFSCTFGTLAAGGKPVQLKVRATVPTRPDRVVTAVQVASEAPGSDPDGANNVAEFFTYVR